MLRMRFLLRYCFPRFRPTRVVPLVSTLLVLTIFYFCVDITGSKVNSTSEEELSDDKLELSDVRQFADIREIADITISPTTSGENVNQTTLLLTTEATIFGNIIEGKNHVVSFNAAPRCGFQTFLEVASLTLADNGFPPAVIHAKKLTNMTLKTEKKLISLFNQSTAPAFISGHYYFTRMPKIGNQSVMMSIIRDPFEKAVSTYMAKDNGTRAGLSFDQCVLSNRSDCYEPLQLIQWFCGYDPRCSQPSEWSFNRAIYNVDNHYTFIGIMEEFDATVKLVERLLPGVFRGISSKYVTLKEKFESTVPLQSSQEVARQVVSALTYDYQFYNYVVEKFGRLKKQFNVQDQHRR